MANEDIRINVVVDQKQAIQQLTQLATEVSKVSRNMNSALSRLTKGFGQLFDEQESIRKQQSQLFAQSHKNMQQAASSAANAIKKLTLIRPEKDIVKDQKAQEKYWESYYKRVKGATKLTGDMKKGFDLTALGIMFFGQAIKRVTDSIAKSSVSTFQDIMHSVEGNVTVYDKLDTGIKKVQYSIGSALEPVLQGIIPVFNTVANIISRYPGLFNAIFIAIAALGTAMAVGGTLSLGLQAVSGGLESMAKIATFAKDNVGKLKGLLAAGMILAIGYKLFDLGLDTKATAIDWFTLLGMAAIAGFTLGGIPGAFAAMAIVATVELGRESVMAFLEDAVALREAWNNVFAGNMSVEDALLTGQWDRTVIPDAATSYEQSLYNQAASQGVFGQEAAIVPNVNLNVDSLVLNLDGSSISESTSETIWDNINVSAINLTGR